jgi:hypothetical protein
LTFNKNRDATGKHPLKLLPMENYCYKWIHREE